MNTRNSYPARIQTTIDPARFRVRITVAQWDKRPDALVDSSAYWFNPEAEACGLDPWRVVDGIDARTDGPGFDVWFASGACMDNMPGATPLYVSDEHGAAMRVHLAFDGYGDEWARFQNLEANDSKAPSPYKAHVLECTAAVQATGAHYNSDVGPKVAAMMAERFGYPALELDPKADFGCASRDFGSHVYMAGGVIRERAKRAAEHAAAAAILPLAGLVLGVLVFNDYKRTTGATIETCSDDGVRITLTGKRGAATVRAETTAMGVRYAIERAHERGNRKDSFADFAAKRAADYERTPLAMPHTARDGMAVADGVASLLGA